MATTTEQLEHAPSLTALYPKALAGTVLELPRKLPVPGLRRSGEGALPDRELVVSDVEVDRGHLARYDRVCGFRVRDELPPTYPHMIAFPLQMQLMTSGEFPFPVIGLVHVRNRIDQKRPILASEPLTVSVSAQNLHKVAAGLEFEMIGEARVGDELVWRSVSNYLRRGGGSGESKDGSSAKKKKSSKPPAHPDAVWKIAGDTGRRYAAVSGDRNPIHMHPLSARLFGFPKPIAHGMWLKARCLAALEGEIPAAAKIDVSFKLPLLLPAKVAFDSKETGTGRSFEVVDARSGKPHLAGSVKPG